MALPTSVTIHCGDQVCSWDQMNRTTNLLVHLADDYKLPNLNRFQLTERGSLVSSFQRAQHLSYLRDATQSALFSTDPYVPMMTALLYAKNSRATDLRDNVFAILPLVSPETTRLAAEYRQSHIELYKQAALGLLTTRLDFLSACQYSEESTNELPSWVPDCSQPWKYYPALVQSTSDDEVDQPEDPVAVYVASKFALKVSGYVLDTLALK